MHDYILYMLLVFTPHMHRKKTENNVINGWINNVVHNLQSSGKDTAVDQGKGEPNCNKTSLHDEKIYLNLHIICIQ